MTWFRRGSDLLSNSAAHNEEEEAEALPEWYCALAEAVFELVYELLSSERCYPSRRRPRIARSQARGRRIKNEKRERRLNEDIANKMKHLLNMRMIEMICIVLSYLFNATRNSSQSSLSVAYTIPDYVDVLH